LVSLLVMREKALWCCPSCQCLSCLFASRRFCSFLPAPSFRSRCCGYPSSGPFFIRREPRFSGFFSRTLVLVISFFGLPPSRQPRCRRVSLFHGLLPLFLSYLHFRSCSFLSTLAGLDAVFVFQVVSLSERVALGLCLSIAQLSEYQTPSWFAKRTSPPVTYFSGQAGFRSPPQFWFLSSWGPSLLDFSGLYNLLSRNPPALPFAEFDLPKMVAGLLPFPFHWFYPILNLTN